MATELGELKYTLTLDESGLSSGLSSAKNKVEEASGKMSGDLKKTEDQAGNTGLSFGKMAGAVALGGVVSSIASDAFGFMKDQIGSVMTAANDWATAQAQLNAGIASTGDVSGVTADAATKLAESIQATTPISREAALTGEDMLLTFTSIGKDVFPTATKAVTDMATRMNGGLTPSSQQLSNTAILVGKALQDPIKGLTALHRVGVDFTDQQKEQIKTMTAAGNQAGAQKIILAELSKEFGGSAAAALGTYAGKQEQMKNNMDDAKASIGAAIEKAIIPLQSALASFVDSDRFKAWIQDAIKFTQDLSDDVVKATKFYEEHKRIINDVAQVLLALGAAFLIISTAIKIAEIAQAAWNAVMAINPIFLIVMIVIAVILLLITHWKTVSAVAEKVWKDITHFISGFVNGAKKDFDEFFGAVKKDWDAFTKVVKDVFNDIVNFLKPIVIVLLALILLPLVPAALLWRAFHEQIIGFFVAIWHFIENVVKIWFALIIWPITLALAIWHEFHNQITGMFLASVHFIESVWSAIVGFFANIMSSIFNAIKGPIGSFGSMLYNAGRDVVMGLVHGITDFAGHAWDAIKNVGKGIMDAAKSILKIFSPSEVFKDIGANVSIGLAGGIDTGADKAMDSTKNLAQGVVKAGQTSMPSGAVTNNNSNIAGATYQIGQVVLSTKDAVDEFFSIGNRNNQLEGVGIAPLAGTVGV